MQKALLLSFVTFTGLALTVPLAPAGAAKKSDAVVKVKAKLDKSVSGKDVVVVNLEIEKGWHLYANPVGNEDFESGQVVVKLGDVPAKITYPAGKLVDDPIIGKYKVYEDKIEIRATLDRPAAKTPLEVSVRLQSCNDKVCLPPATVKVMVP